MSGSTGDARCYVRSPITVVNSVRTMIPFFFVILFKFQADSFFLETTKLSALHRYILAFEGNAPYRYVIIT